MSALNGLKNTINNVNLSILSNTYLLIAKKCFGTAAEKFNLCKPKHTSLLLEEYFQLSFLDRKHSKVF